MTRGEGVGRWLLREWKDSDNHPGETSFSNLQQNNWQHRSILLNEQSWPNNVHVKDYFLYVTKILPLMYDFGGEALLYAKWPNTDVSREKQSKTWVEHWGEKKIKHRLMDCYFLLGKCWGRIFHVQYRDWQWEGCPLLVDLWCYSDASCDGQSSSKDFLLLAT